MIDYQPFGRAGLPEIARIDTINDEVEFTDGTKAQITKWLAGGQSVQNPLHASAIVAGPWQGKWLVIRMTPGMLGDEDDDD